MIIIAEISAIDPATLITEVIRVTNATHYTYQDKTYIPVLGAFGGYQQTLFSRNTTSGTVTVDITDLDLDNTDGLFDKYKRFGFAGHSVSIYLLDDFTSSPNATNLYFKGITASVEHNIDVMKINLTNNLEKLVVPMTEKVFSSNNSGPVGLEGNEDTLKNKVKPILYGRVFNIELVQVNTPILMYCCNYSKTGIRKSINRVLVVRDKGGELGFNGDYVSAVLLESATILLGNYATCLNEGLIRLRSKPVGEVTADIYESEVDQCSAPRVVQRILQDVMGFTAGTDYNAGDLEELHIKNACPVGVYIQGNETVLSTITSVLDSIGAWMCPDSAGSFRFGRVEDPSNFSSSALIDSIHEDSLKLIGTNDNGKNIPAFKVELKHTRNWKVTQGGSLLESIDAAVRDALSKDYVTETVTNDGVKLIHPLSETLTYETLLHQPTATFTTGGSCDIVKAGSFTGSQISGTGGSVTLDGNLTIFSGTGVYRVVQNVTTGLTPGATYYIELYSVSGICTVKVKDGGALLKEQVVTNSTTESQLKEISFIAASASFNLEIETSTAAVIGSLRIRESAPGLSPKQEAERRFSLQSKTQDLYTLDIDLEESRTFRLGQVVTFSFDRFDLAEGKKFLVIGKDEDAKDEVASIDIWKPNEY